MLSLIARATQEMLLLVPSGLREAAEALGVNRWRTVLGVLLPSVLGGVLTGTVLALARAAGGDRAAAVLQLDLSRRVLPEPIQRGAAQHPGGDLHAVGGPQPHRVDAGLGVGARPTDVHTHRQRGGAHGARPQPKGSPMTNVTEPQPPSSARTPVRPRIWIRSEPGPAPVADVRPVLPPAGPAPSVPSRAVLRLAPRGEVVFDTRDVSISYGTNTAVAGVTLPIYRNLVTAIIGPSGCGKTTFLRSLNRMNDSIPSFKITGRVLYHGHDVYGPEADRIEVRRRIGMVFQKPNPFPKSIYDNIAWAPRNLGMRSGLSERVEQALSRAALWDEVKDRLKASALGLSGGQQQRLCIARAIAIEPDVLLLDEPASALDPVATLAIEELTQTLKESYTIVIVTHNMQQAARIADRTAFFSVKDGVGTLVEYDDTDIIFTRPADTRTSDYVRGRFG